MKILKRLALASAGVAALCAPALAQNLPITSLPQVTLPADIDLFLLEHVNGPNGQKTSKLLASDLANYIQNRINGTPGNATPFSVPVEQYGTINGTSTANATANTNAFASALATWPHVTCQDDKTYVVNQIVIPALTRSLSGACTILPGPASVAGGGIITSSGNTHLTIDGPTVNALVTVLTPTGNTSSSSTTVSALSSTAGLVPGLNVSGQDVQAGTTVVSVGTGSVVLSAPPLVSHAGVTLIFTQPYDAIQYGAASNITIRNTTLNGRYCISGGNSDTVRIHHNVCNGYVMNGIDHSVTSGTHFDIHQDDNIVSGNLASATYGVSINGGSNVTLDHNTTHGTQVHGVGIANAINYSMSFNHVYGSTHEGAFAVGNLTNGSILGNKLYLAGTSLDNGISVDATGGNGIIDLDLSGNLISGAGAAPIFIGEVGGGGSLVLRAHAHGNSILNPYSTASDAYEAAVLLVGAGAQYNTVDENQIINSSGKMLWQVDEVASTDGAPSHTTVGQNYGVPGTSGFNNLIGTGSVSLGGVQPTAAVSHQWVASISTAGVPSLTQPAFADVSGSATCAQLPARTGDVASAAGSCATAIQPNTVTSADLRQSPALSLMGNGASTTANVVDIVGTANQVARINSAGNALGFGSVNLASSFAVSGALPVANGGTGQTAAGTAAANAIGAAESGANSSITSLSGLSTPLSVAQGGTGNTGGAWTAWTPVLAFTGGSGTSTTSASGAYQVIGKRMCLRGLATENYTTAPAISITLPNSASSVSSGEGLTGQNLSTGVLLSIAGATGASTTLPIYKYDGTAAATATGQVLAFFGCLEIL